ncbi:hypothetical protein LIER_33894 [Lithospermum erythrorhizon]|uniref:Uncharacterized protein n=1 Tax=Lithospermum erythrorhizon TaxID=34254 RepID=A0AAV3RXZ1_LITER
MSQSFKTQCHKEKKKEGDHHPDRREPRKAPLTRHDVRGSSNTDLQKQIDELKTLLKDITPGRGLVKHITLLPFSKGLRHAKRIQDGEVQDVQRVWGSRQSP